MGYLATDDLTHERAAAGDSMGDTCAIYTVTQAQNANGENIETETLSATIDCRFDGRSSANRYGADATRLQYDALVRVPLGTVVTAVDRVKITKRFGVAITPVLVFDVTGTPLAGVSALTVYLNRVTV